MIDCNELMRNFLLVLRVLIAPIGFVKSVISKARNRLGGGGGGGGGGGEKTPPGGGGGERGDKKPYQ